MEFVAGRSLDVLIGRKGLKTRRGARSRRPDRRRPGQSPRRRHRPPRPQADQHHGDERGPGQDPRFRPGQAHRGHAGAEAGRTMTLGQEERPRTEEGYILGTAAYMSPNRPREKRSMPGPTSFPSGRSFMRCSPVTGPSDAIAGSRPWPPSSTRNRSLPQP